MLGSAGQVFLFLRRRLEPDLYIDFTGCYTAELSYHQIGTRMASIRNGNICTSPRRVVAGVGNVCSHLSPAARSTKDQEEKLASVANDSKNRRNSIGGNPRL
jgi:hypothetical protein